MKLDAVAKRLQKLAGEGAPPEAGDPLAQLEATIASIERCGATLQLFAIVARLQRQVRGYRPLPGGASY